MDGQAPRPNDEHTAGRQRAGTAAPRATGRNRRTTRGPEAVLPPELGNAVGFRLRQAFSVADRLFAETFGEIEINAAQYALMMVVRHNPGCQTSAAGSLLGITSNNLVPLLDQLVARGYMRRRVSTVDRRVRHLRLTPAGEKLWEELVERHNSLQERLEMRIGKENAADMLRLLVSYID